MAVHQQCSDVTPQCSCELLSKLHPFKNNVLYLYCFHCIQMCQTLWKLNLKSCLITSSLLRRTKEWCNYTPELCNKNTGKFLYVFYKKKLQQQQNELIRLKIILLHFLTCTICGSSSKLYERSTTAKQWHSLSSRMSCADCSLLWLMLRVCSAGNLPAWSNTCQCRVVCTPV